MGIAINDILSFLQTEALEYHYYGKEDLEILRFCPLSSIKPQSITWIKRIQNCNLKEIEPLDNLLIVTNELPNYDYTGYNLLVTEQPKVVFFEILRKYFTNTPKADIAPSSIVETKQIGSNVSIGQNCYICSDAVIGDDVVIRNNVIIECPVVIGDNCVIDSGTVIGSHGYGYYKKDGISKKVPDFAGVKIGNRVEIGANTCIERGTLTDTIIADDVKLGSLCLVGHNVNIGKRSMIISQSVLCGSCKIGQDVYIAPGAVIMNRLTVGDGAFVGISAVVNKNVPPNQLVTGNPAEIVKNGLRFMKIFKV